MERDRLFALKPSINMLTEPVDMFIVSIKVFSSTMEACSSVRLRAVVQFTSLLTFTLKVLLTIWSLAI